MKYFKLFESFVNEAKTEVKLKDLDFNKLDKIFDVLTTPQPGLEDSEYETLSDEKPGSFKYVTKFLKNLAEAHAKGSQPFIDFISKNKNKFPDDVTVIDDITDYLKDKNLAKQIQKLNDICYSMDYNLYGIDPENVVKYYNELADFVSKFNTKNIKESKELNEAKISYSLEDLMGDVTDKDYIKMCELIARTIGEKPKDIAVITSEDDEFGKYQARFRNNPTAAINNPSSETSTYYDKKSNVVTGNDGSTIMYFIPSKQL